MPSTLLLSQLLPLDTITRLSCTYPFCSAIPAASLCCAAVAFSFCRVGLGVQSCQAQGRLIQSFWDIEPVVLLFAVILLVFFCNIRTFIEGLTALVSSQDCGKLTVCRRLNRILFKSKFEASVPRVRIVMARSSHRFPSSSIEPAWRFALLTFPVDHEFT